MLRYSIISISILACVLGRSQDAMVNTGNLHISNSASMAVFGNIKNTGNWSSSDGTLILAGTTGQLINGTDPINAGTLELNNVNNAWLENKILIADEFKFLNGILFTDRLQSANHFVHFLQNATQTTASDNSHIDGFIRKSGNTAFTFPTGDDSQLQALSISAPSLLNDSYEATYLEADPITVSNTANRDANIQHISDCEYWELNTLNGNSSVQVRLEFDANSCGTADPSSLLVAQWDGTMWKDRGNTQILGTAAAGSIRSTSIPANNFFSLGTTTPLNVLPVELLYFTAETEANEVWLLWHTVSERNNAHFDVQRSLDTDNWQTVGTLDGAGNSNIGIDYRLLDQEPFAGLSYYRLKQVDYDGSTTYSQIETIFFAPEVSSIVYPNPTNGDFFVQLNAQADTPSITLYNSLGQKMNVDAQTIHGALFQLNTASLPAGSYIVKVTGAHYSKTHELIVQ